MKSNQNTQIPRWMKAIYTLSIPSEEDKKGIIKELKQSWFKKIDDNEYTNNDIRMDFILNVNTKLEKIYTSLNFDEI